MSEAASSKIKWIVVGTVIGTVISLSVDYWVKPLLVSKPSIEVSASRDKHGQASFRIANTGKVAATDVAVTLWATAPFAARSDITSVEHAGGTADSACEVGIYQARLRASGSVASALNTEARAVLVQCKRINPQEEWRGRLEYQGPEAVFGLLAHVKHAETSENKYARFADGIGQ